MKAEHIEPSNFTAVRPTARAVAQLYLKQFHPGARSHGDPVPTDGSPVPGTSMSLQFETALGAPIVIFLGEASGGGWQVKARARLSKAEPAAA